MIVTAWNPPTDELEKTYLSAYAAEGVTSFAVKNSNRFVNDKMILVGKMSFEQSEILKTNTPADNVTISLDAASEFPHNIDDPIYLLRYDRVVFFSAPTVAGTKTEIADLPVNVTDENEKTQYEDVGAPTTTVYWTKYRNSLTGEETEYSDYIRADGADDESIGAIAERASRRLRDPGFNLITPDMYVDFANEVNDDLMPQTERPYGFLRKKAVIARTATQAYFDLPADYVKFDYLIVKNTVASTSSTKPLFPIPYKQFMRSYAPQSGADVITRITLDPDNKKVLIKPTPRTTLADAFELWYYGDFTRFTEFSDLIQTPNGNIYYYKFLAEGFSIKAERDPSFAGLAQKYETKYGNHVVMMQRSNRRDVGTPRSFADSERTSSINNPPRRRYTL